MDSSGLERSQSVSHRFAARAAQSAMTGLPPAPSDQAPPTNGAEPSRHRKAASDGRTGIEHRPQGELGAPRSQPYTVWYQGKVVFFCRTKGEAAEALGRELRRSRLRVGV